MLPGINDRVEAQRNAIFSGADVEIARTLHVLVASVHVFGFRENSRQ